MLWHYNVLFISSFGISFRPSFDSSYSSPYWFCYKNMLHAIIKFHCLYYPENTYHLLEINRSVRNNEKWNQSNFSQSFPPNQRHGVSSSHRREKNLLFQRIKIKEFYHVVYYFVRKRKKLTSKWKWFRYVYSWKIWKCLEIPLEW